MTMLQLPYLRQQIQRWANQNDTKMHDPVVNMVNVEKISWYDVYMLTNRPLNTLNMRKQCSELKVKISRKYVTT